MARHATPSMIVTLLTICASLAAFPFEIDVAGDPEEGNAILAMDNLLKDVVVATSKQTVVYHKDLGDILAAFRKLPSQAEQQKNEIDSLKNLKSNEYTKTLLREKMLQRTLDLLANQLNIKQLVKDYDQSKDWRALRKGLEAALDHDSPAYKQLQKISWSEQYAPWQIAYEGHTELVFVLVFAGNGIDMRDGSQDNFLHGAVAGGQKELVNMLLDSGADIESGNGWGNRPLALACKYGRLAVAKLLWDRGAQVDGINYDEKWAGLARAADEGYLEIVKFMVQIGASTTIKDRDGRTPLEVARRKGHTAIVEYLSKFPH